MTDKVKAMSEYLMYRGIVTSELSFSDDTIPYFPNYEFDRVSIHTSHDLESHLKRTVEEACQDGKAALMLSGGMDSAILARFMPKGSMTYTLKCVVEGKEVYNETQSAKEYAEMCELRNKVVEISWDDMMNNTPILMKHKGAPIHSIEAQIYKAACTAREDGYTKLIFGENADIIYGGMDGLLAKDWTIGEFIERYSYVLPYKVLREFEMNIEPFKKYEQNGKIEAHSFINEYFRKEALGTYNNSCKVAEIEFVGPYSTTKWAEAIDYTRIRGGESKYLVREIYHRLYPNKEIAKKLPMPRATNEWMDSWEGPQRKEFYPGVVREMSGDQKWMVYALELYLNMLEN